MLSALLENLVEKPDLYLDEMMVFLWDEFQHLVMTSSVRERDLSLFLHFSNHVNLLLPAVTGKSNETRAECRQRGLRKVVEHSLQHRNITF